MAKKKSKRSLTPQPKKRRAGEPFRLFLRQSGLSNDSLGSLVRQQGLVTSQANTSLGTVIEEVAPCSCGGENVRCYKCDGTGIFKRQRVIAPVLPEHRSRSIGRQAGAVFEVQFSNDQRGANYGIREYGRFASAPEFDADE